MTSAKPSPIAVSEQNSLGAETHIYVDAPLVKLYKNLPMLGGVDKLSEEQLNALYKRCPPMPSILMSEEMSEEMVLMSEEWKHPEEWKQPQDAHFSVRGLGKKN